MAGATGVLTSKAGGSLLSFHLIYFTLVSVFLYITTSFFLRMPQNSSVSIGLVCWPFFVGIASYVTGKSAKLAGFMPI